MYNKELKQQKTRSLTVRENGRSADATSPNFILGCNAPCAYCYVRRWNRPKVYVNTNVDEILQACDNWVQSKPWPKIPNQTDDKWYTIDIACDTDICRHWNDYDWLKVFQWFKEHDKLKATFATKYVNNKLLQFDPEGKIRIRFSLMPKIMSDIVEHGTSKISTRIKAINRFQEAGYDVHINYSPIIVFKDYLTAYKQLLNEVKENVRELDKVGLEAIFLTHNENLHKLNLECGMQEQESYLWIPEMQEEKQSQYGGTNVRYKWKDKAGYVQDFIKLVEEVTPECKIRYIF